MQPGERGRTSLVTLLRACAGVQWAGIAERLRQPPVDTAMVMAYEQCYPNLMQQADGRLAKPALPDAAVSTAIAGVVAAGQRGEYPKPVALRGKGSPLTPPAADALSGATRRRCYIFSMLTYE